MSYYKVGISKKNITYYKKSLSMQGFGRPKQKTKAMETPSWSPPNSFPLYSRAFVIVSYNAEDKVTGITALVVADIWACSEKIKTKVLQKLKQKGINDFVTDNLMISGTHNHCGAGGYFDEPLYDLTIKGTKTAKTENTETIANGICASIVEAYGNKTKANVYLRKGDLELGWNRSEAAYEKNVDAADYATNVDTEMLFLKFNKILDDGKEEPIGILNWFAIHPTDRGKKTRDINGDNKGYAAYLFEQYMEDVHQNVNFVAAFANANCGDVNRKPEQKANGDYKTDLSYKKRLDRMVDSGEKQYKKALELFLENDLVEQKLEGAVSYAYSEKNMSAIQITENKRTWIPAIGLSMLAGSTENGPSALAGWPFCLAEGITDGNFKSTQEYVLDAVKSIASSHKTGYGLSDFYAVLIANQITSLKTRSVESLSKEEHMGHYPKPIVLVAGGISPTLTPEILPLQMIRIGGLIITAIPSEITTMAGRRLRNEVLKDLKEYGVEHVALAAYSNHYAQYIATIEEYNAQHYEGASTLFGPHTLEAYIHNFLAIGNRFKLA